MVNQFTYTARDSGGEKLSGQIIALSAEGALDALQETGIYVTHIEPLPWFSSRVSRVILASHERVLLLESWASLLEAGISMEVALARLREAIRQPSVRRALWDIQGLLRDGRPLPDAVAASGLLPFSWVNVLEAGQKRGDFIGPLLVLQRRSEQIRQTIRELASSLLMPSILIGLVFAWLWVFSIWVVPRLSQCIVDVTGTTNPVLAGLKQFSAASLPATILLGVGIGLLLLVILRGNRADEIMGTIPAWAPVGAPLIGPLVSKIHLIVIASELQMQMEAGIPAANALYALSQSMPRASLRQELLIAYRSVIAGAPAWQALAGLRMMPASALALLAAGDASGKLPEMLGAIVRETSLDLETEAERLAIKMRAFAGIMAGIIVAALVFTVAGVLSATFNSIAKAAATSTI